MEDLKRREAELKSECNYANMILTMKKTTCGASEIRAANTKRMKIQYLISEIQTEIQKRFQEGESKKQDRSRKAEEKEETQRVATAAMRTAAATP
ncbi:unnamed protein product, partial [Polarella glacialis]